MLCARMPGAKVFPAVVAPAWKAVAKTDVCQGTLFEGPVHDFGDSSTRGWIDIAMRVGPSKGKKRD